MRRQATTWRSILGLAALGLVGSAAAKGTDWPQFRGPARQGTTTGDNLLESWGETPPRVSWRRPIGRGYSAVSAVGDRLYTMDADAEHERVLCLEAATGATLWSVEAGNFVEAELGDGGPRSTPTVVDGVVYAATQQARLLALAAADGSVLWQRDLTEMGPVPRFGYATSPLVDGELVVIEVGDTDTSPGVVAFDRASGETRWQSLAGPAGYSSPLPVEIDGVRQYLLFRRAGQEAVGLSTSGEVLWRFATPDALAAIVMPIYVPPDRVFLSTSDDTFGGHMLRVGLSEGAFAAEEIWSERLMRNHFNTSVAVGGSLFGFDNGTLRCLDADTGEHRWARRGFGKGSLIAAGEKLYVLSDGGLVAQIDATPDGYVESGRLQVMEGRSWTAPSLAHGHLYVRDFDEIVSIDLRAVAARGEETTP